MQRSSSLGRAGPFIAAPLAMTLVLGVCVSAAGAQLEDAVRVREKANGESAESQKRIDGLSERTADLTEEYRTVTAQIDALRVYVGQLETIVATQKQEIETVRDEIENVTVVGRQITPLMLRMIESLEQFVALDVPFLPIERSERLTELRDIMARADVSDSEKYRRLLEAYQIENEYGRTIEAYRGELEIDDSARVVDYLRIGRIALYYQTLDGQSIGVWDSDREGWETLDGGHRSAIRQGIRVARKETAPDLLRLPIQAATAAEVVK
ncbi:MAG: DUF3450 domain-containing protein [Myxococcales bacterium]|nr:DUF3450 domain-containing protein [Myxococcales bacterium]HIK85223.1 DUF3450 domain-containing protein [Myxococcales bacterium]